MAASSRERKTEGEAVNGDKVSAGMTTMFWNHIVSSVALLYEYTKSTEFSSSFIYLLISLVVLEIRPGMGFQ